jgi:hypothetical protein
LKFILTDAAANEWSLASLSQEKVTSSLQASTDFDKESIIQTLTIYSKSTKERPSDVVHTLDTDKVKVYFAVQIFKEMKKQHIQELDVFRKTNQQPTLGSKVASIKEPTEKVVFTYYFFLFDFFFLVFPFKKVVTVIRIYEAMEKNFNGR